MKVRVGWSTEYAAQKFDIELDETDFLQIVTEAGVGEALAAKVPFFPKFTLLEATARYLSEAESLRVITGEQERHDARARIEAAKAECGSALSAVKVILGLEKRSEPAPAP